MNTAIKCPCGTVIVYDHQTTTVFDCPHCKRRWLQKPPPLIDDSGIEAQCMPYLCAGLPTLLDDEVCRTIIERITASIDSHNEGVAQGLFGWREKKEHPPRVAFVFELGKPVVVEMSVCE